MQVDNLPSINLQSDNPRPQQSKPAEPSVQTNNPRQQSPQMSKPQLNQPQIPRTVFLKTQHATPIEKQPKRSTHKKQTKSPTRKLMATTHRSVLMQSTHNSNDLILVYLMYKEQKLSLFLTKGVTFDYLIKKMYKEIYIYEKQTYSISNAILKNLLFKITGFQTIDNDILYDYEFKYKRGTLEQQKFFLPFKQQDHKNPFKIYTRIQSNSYGGNQFLARNYSDGEWIIVSSIKKNLFDDEKINIIKKSLKNNTIACSLLMKNTSSNLSQINWLETKHYLIIVSEYFTETLEQNLTKNHSFYPEQKCQEIFIYYAKWLAFTFKQIVSSNIQNFKKLSLQHIVLNPSDGQPRISVFENVVSCIDFAQRRRSVITNGKRASQKIQDNFYYETYQYLMKSLKNYLKRTEKSEKMFNDFLDFIQERNNSAEFTFDTVSRYFAPEEMNNSFMSPQKPKSQHPLRIDFTSKLQKIIANIHATKTNSILSDQETLIISEIKDEIQKLFCMQNMRKNQQRNETKSIIQMLGTASNFGDLKKQNIGNVSEFKKEEERKFTLKKKERMYIQQILNELNQNENFIKTTKQNNVASIEFYLKKSDDKIKKQMVQKIEKKYKKFFERKPTNFEDDGFNSNGNQEYFMDNFEGDGDNSHGKLTLPNFTKSRKNILADSHAIKEQNHFQVVNNLLDKENFACQILSRLEQRSSYGKGLNVSMSSKLYDSGSPSFQKKGSKLEQLFINRRNYSKEERVALKKKQYGIYLEQAEKQFSKLRLYKRPKPTKTST